MVGNNEQPTNSVGQFKLADGNVALKIGTRYYTTDTSGRLRSSGAIPATLDDGQIVGTQS